MTKVTVITSGKGGVGKTSISVNTAVELGRRGLRTCLFDADLGLANANILLGIHPTKTLSSYILGPEKLQDIVIETKHGFDIIPGSSGIEEMANLSPNTIAELIEEFSELSSYDHFIVDTSSGISRSVLSFCLAADQIVLVITADATSLTDAYGLLKVLSLNNYQGSVKILVNRCPSIPKSKETYIHFKRVSQKHLNIAISPIGAVLEDKNFANALAQQQPILHLFPHSMASQCVRAFTINLLSHEGELGQAKNVTTFWSNYFMFLRLQEDNPNKGSLPPEKAVAKASPKESPPDQKIHKGNLGKQELQPLHVVPPPIFPQALPPKILALYILHLHRQGELHRSAIEKFLFSEPLLTYEILRILSASNNNLASEPLSPSNVIDTLGLERLQKLLLNLSLQSALTGYDRKREEFLTTYWTNNLSTALQGKALAELGNLPFPEEIYLGCLLHNISILFDQLGTTQQDITETAQVVPDETQNEKKSQTGLQNYSVYNVNFFQKIGASQILKDIARYHPCNLSTLSTALPVTKLACLSIRLQDDREEDDVAVHIESFFSIDKDKVLKVKKNAGKKASDLLKQITGEPHSFPSNLSAQERLQYMALEQLSFKAILPSSNRPSYQTKSFAWLFDGLAQLFGINRAILFLTDHKTQSLTAKSAVSPHRTQPVLRLEELILPLADTASEIVKAHLTGSARFTSEQDLNHLGDKQILHVLAAEILISLPLKHPDKNMGILVLGTDKADLNFFKNKHSSLDAFSRQITKNLQAQTPF